MILVDSSVWIDFFSPLPGRAGKYRDAAAIFRLARSKGTTLSTIDTLIAAIAMHHGVAVFTLDKDFSRIARLTGLPLYRPPSP